MDHLRGMAASGSLDPRNDAVWCEGMSDWRKAGEVDGIFESKAAPGQEAAPVAVTNAGGAQSYAATGGYAADAGMLQQAVWPGARRRSYLLVTILLPILAQIAMAVVTLLVGAGEGGAQMMSTLSIAVSVLLFALGLFFGLQRLANVGMSRWWYLGLLVPFLNLWIGYRMFACPAGYAYHKNMDGPGIALAILYWLMIALFVIFAIGMILVMLGVFGSLEMQELLDQIQQANPSSGQ
jgi:uncharacterized membrane protein YhaH (DUF805 family)